MGWNNMAIKKYKPTTPGRRFMSTIVGVKSGNIKPEKSLISILKNRSGRNNVGKITVRHHGGRSKRMYRTIDFKRNKFNIEGVAKTIEYDPNRNCFIALIVYRDGEKRYILAPDKFQVGDKIISSEAVSIRRGNSCLIKNVPEGINVHNIELYPGHGGQIARSAGNYAKILGKDDTKKFIIIELSSGEVRKIRNECRVTIGEIGNKDFSLINFGKAGRNRLRGIRPTVRGSAMNPVDHPHGGGEGKTGIGRKAPLTPWGKKALGLKTRKKNKKTDMYIIRTRASKKRR